MKKKKQAVSSTKVVSPPAGGRLVKKKVGPPPKKSERAIMMQNLQAACRNGTALRVAGVDVDQLKNGVIIDTSSIQSVMGPTKQLGALCKALFGVLMSEKMILQDGDAYIPFISLGDDGQMSLLPGDQSIELLFVMGQSVEHAAAALAVGKKIDIRNAPIPGLKDLLKDEKMVAAIEKKLERAVKEVCDPNSKLAFEVPTGDGKFSRIKVADGKKVIGTLENLDQHRAPVSEVKGRIETVLCYVEKLDCLFFESMLFIRNPPAKMKKLEEGTTLEIFGTALPFAEALKAFLVKDFTVVPGTGTLANQFGPTRK